MGRHSDYPPLADYALIGDCRCAALVSRAGSVDWSCMPRFDSDSCFGRLLDWHRGGHWQIAPDGGEGGDGGEADDGARNADDSRSGQQARNGRDPGERAAQDPPAEDRIEVTRRYLPGTMILETCFSSPRGAVRLLDFFAVDGENGRAGIMFGSMHVRIVEGLRGEMMMRTLIRPRLDGGEIIPMMRCYEPGYFTATGSDAGLFIWSDATLHVHHRSELSGRFMVCAGQRTRFTLGCQLPEFMGRAHAILPDAEGVDQCLDRTLAWWTRWSDAARHANDLDLQTARSMLVLKSLTYEPTGAIIAAPTTSLPEALGGGRNWDYRFSWVRDSVFTVRALYDLGYRDEAERFLQFIQRSAAGSAQQLQIMYAVDGKRRLTEITLDWLEGYRGSRPVRLGNVAAKQNQLDVYGEIMELARLWRATGHPIGADYWDFLIDVLDTVCERWDDRDYGIWEFRGGPRHYVHSKAMCWGALEHGIVLAQQDGRGDGHIGKWTAARDAIRQAIETRGYDSRRGVFVQEFDATHLDSALLLLPRIGFVAADDPRMVRTVDAIRAPLAQGGLDSDGLLLRYSSPDGLEGREGSFLPCTFWLASCLAMQDRRDLAERYYARASACANDLGLFSEEIATGPGEHMELLGNFPQALTHVSQIMARLALSRSESMAAGDMPRTAPADATHTPHAGQEAGRPDSRNSAPQRDEGDQRDYGKAGNRSGCDPRRGDNDAHQRESGGAG